MGRVQPGELLPGDLDDMRYRADDSEDTEAQTPHEGDSYWLSLLNQAYSQSTDYMDTSIRHQWERALDRFHNQHPRGSKYTTEAYKHRAKVFRPKTRSACRRAEAMAAKALFGTNDLIDVKAQNAGSAVQAASALVTKEVMQYRLEHTMPWFSTCMGARQDAFNYGMCISLQTWAFEQEDDVSYVELFNEDGSPQVDEDGNELGEEMVETRIVRDEPTIELIAPENFRFDPNADWRNPVKDSPYLTIMLPMFAGEVIERMQRENPVTGMPEWREYSLAQIKTSQERFDTNESMRQARAGDKREDPQDVHHLNEYATCWVFLNIMRDEGVDYAFYTLGTHYMLTDPVPVEELLPLGRESIVVGFSIIESHRTYPIGGNELAAPHQKELNDIANQRLDNVQLALNRRWLYRRGANVNLSQLKKSIPGGGIGVGDLEKDVKEINFQDVTGSSYQEQDRLSQELDELLGMFSGSSVQANRSLNETVGGMNLLQNDAVTVAEYELRTWIETWVEPVLRNLQKLIAMFETDETVLAIAAEESKLFQRYGENFQIDQLLDRELIVSVNVGIGNTDPTQKLNRIAQVLNAIGQLPDVAARLNGDELAKEAFGAMGFSEGQRFMLNDEEFQKRQQAQQAPDSSLQTAQLKAQTDKELKAMELEWEREEAAIEQETALLKVAAELGLEREQLYEKLGIERDKIRTNRDITALKEGNRTREMNIKRVQGSGI